MIKGRESGDAWDEMALLAMDICARPVHGRCREALMKVGISQKTCNLIGLFGGTFDPIHFGHLRPAVRAVPGAEAHGSAIHGGGQSAAVSRRRSHSAELRLAMVKAAVAGEKSFVVDDREVRRTGARIRSIRSPSCVRNFPDRSLCLMLGMDAFLGLPNWHRWREILDLAHVVVWHRPCWKAPEKGPLGEVMVDRGTGSVRELHEQKAGRVYIHAVTLLEISSTEVRNVIVSGTDPRYLVPDEVRKIIVETGCYAPRRIIVEDSSQSMRRSPAHDHPHRPRRAPTAARHWKASSRPRWKT